MKSLHMLILGVFLCVGRAARAQDGDTTRLTTLDQTIAAAVKSNPTQEVYLQQMKQAALNYKGAQGFLYPNASLRISSGVDVNTFNLFFRLLK